MGNAGTPLNLATTFLRLRSDVSIEPLHVDETFWPRLMGGQLGTFQREYLVTVHDYDADWTVWEMHPNGDEIVCLLDGAVTMTLERDGREQVFELDDACAYVLVPRGTWHTARVRRPGRMLFITAGEGTQHRPVRR